jgi:aspartyl protease family protein
VSGEQSLDVIWYLLALVLVGSALMNHRISLRHGLGMVLVWVGLFAIAAWGYSNRDALWERIEKPLNSVRNGVGTSSETPVTVEGAARPTVRIPAGEGGHYWVEAQINGRPARFLIDSGATMTVLSRPLATASGLNIRADETGARLRTATGDITAHRSSIPSFAIGSIRVSDLPVLVLDTPGETNVIGMDILSKLNSWRVENGVMVLEQ